MALLFKQTIGICICIVAIGNKLLFVRNKDELSIYLKSLLYRILGIFIPVILLICYLLSTCSLSDFILYAVKGILEFSNAISYYNLFKFNIIGILSILIPIVILYNWIDTVVLEKVNEKYLIMVYGIAVFSICFPISDNIHFLIAVIPSLTLYFININNLIKKAYNLKYFKVCLNYISIIFMLIMFIMSIKNYYEYYKCYKATNLEHYKYIPIDSELENNIIEVNEYIVNLEEKILILDSSAALYMIPLNKYNKDYDMLLNGNLGYKGNEKIINEIQNDVNIKYLILNDKYNKNWQTPIEIIEYVKNNKRKVGEISIFDIYK